METSAKVNFKAKVINEITFYSQTKRQVGDEVFVHLFDDGKVLIYSPSERGKLGKPVFDTILDSIQEASKFFKCICSTDFDVKGAWDKMMSDRYF